MFTSLTRASAGMSSIGSITAYTGGDDLGGANRPSLNSRTASVAGGVKRVCSQGMSGRVLVEARG
jgi:hypothetical protein